MFFRIFKATLIACFSALPLFTLAVAEAFKKTADAVYEIFEYAKGDRECSLESRSL